MNFRPVNVLATFSTKLEIQIALTLLYLVSNFGEWYMYHLCKGYGNSAWCLCINTQTPTLVVYSCSEITGTIGVAVPFIWKNCCLKIGTSKN